MARLPCWPQISKRVLPLLKVVISQLLCGNGHLLRNKGHAKAQYNLGLMYAKGKGVLQDYVRAHMWYNIAAMSGESKNASKNRDIVAKRMTPSQLEKAQDLARECVAKDYKGC